MLEPTCCDSLTLILCALCIILYWFSLLRFLYVTSLVIIAYCLFLFLPFKMYYVSSYSLSVSSFLIWTSFPFTFSRCVVGLKISIILFFLWGFLRRFFPFDYFIACCLLSFSIAVIFSFLFVLFVFISDLFLSRLDDSPKYDDIFVSETVCHKRVRKASFQLQNVRY